MWLPTNICCSQTAAPRHPYPCAPQAAGKKNAVASPAPALQPLPDEPEAASDSDGTPLLPPPPPPRRRPAAVGTLSLALESTCSMERQRLSRSVQLKA